MSNPQSPEATRDRIIRDAKKHKQHRDLHAEKACPNPPAVPLNVQLTFQLTEQKVTLDFSPKVKWGAVTRDEQGHLTSIDHYVVQMVAVDSTVPAPGQMGNPVEFEDLKPRLRELFKKEPKDSNPDDYSIVWPVVPRPQTWYWQARVAAVDRNKCQGIWSPWTAPVLPWKDTSTLPPAPANLVLTFDDQERGRHDRYRGVVTFDEVQNFDYPGGDHQSDVSRYAVELQAGTNPVVAGGGSANTTWGGPDRVKEREAKDATTDTQRTMVFEKVHKHYFYRARARSIDRFNRRGDWSGWFPGGALANIGVTPSDTDKPPVPTNVDLNMNGHQARVDWDEVVDPETGILSKDVAFFEVRVTKTNNADGTLLNDSHGKPCRDTYCVEQHKAFKIEKPKGDFYGWVRSVDSAGNKSAWAGYPTWPSAKDTPHKPPAPTGVNISFLKTDDSKKWSQAKAVVSWNPVQQQSDDVAYYIVEMEPGDVVGGNPVDAYTKNKHRWSGRVHAPEVIDDTGNEELDGTLYGAGTDQKDHSDSTGKLEWMHGNAKRGHYYRARVRAVDKDGQKSDWGPNPPDGWKASGAKCSPAQVIASSASGGLKQPNNVQTVSTAKGVMIRWNHPQDQDGFPDQTIDYFRVQVATQPHSLTQGAPASAIMEDDNYVHAKRAHYPIGTSDWSNTSGPYYLGVQSVDELGNGSLWTWTTTANTSSDVDTTTAQKSVSPGPAGLAAGDIDDPKYFAKNMRGFSVGATFPTLPNNTNYPAGTPFWLTADVTVGGQTVRGQRFYYVVDGTATSGQNGNGWDNRVFLGQANGAVDGGGVSGKRQIVANSIDANLIVANTITANEMASKISWSKDFVLIAAGAFRTDTPPAARIQMSQVDGPDQLSFYNGSSTSSSNGRVYFQPVAVNSNDLIDMVVPVSSTGPANSGLRWGNAVGGGNANANSRLLNNGAIQLGRNSLTIGDADSNTVRIYYDPAGGSAGHGAVVARKGTGPPFTEVNLGAFP